MEFINEQLGLMADVDKTEMIENGDEPPVEVNKMSNASTGSQSIPEPLTHESSQVWLTIEGSEVIFCKTVSG